jgi:hypothetical protein
MLIYKVILLGEQLAFSTILEIEEEILPKKYCSPSALN